MGSLRQVEPDKGTPAHGLERRVLDNKRPGTRARTSTSENKHGREQAAHHARSKHATALLIVSGGVRKMR